MSPTMRLVSVQPHNWPKQPQPAQPAKSYPATKQHHMTSHHKATELNAQLNADHKAREARARFADNIVRCGLNDMLKSISYSKLLRVGVRQACPKSWAGTQVFGYQTFSHALSMVEIDRHGPNR